ncbi:unnamed protein product [Wuchereria bancrofti]|uniref:Tyrosine-protein phosphatase domain-containing protein n=1 Tax=Wuchereria bancrofti TaxID=6293 RepID=A0A3P7EMF1_WUCBA|nr:unnamed protein product [Wuchereria bancrofti]
MTSIFLMLVNVSFPNDDTLVSIHSTINDSTFINASAIHDCDPKQANYIATQSPLPETITDFWQMIWEQLSRNNNYKSI